MKNNFKAVDQKLDDVADKVALMLKVNKVHFVKMTDFMEQKFGTAVAISERLIHTAYNNKLAPGALHHEALLEIVKYVNKIAENSKLLSFLHQPSDLFLVETSYVYKPDEKIFVLVMHVPLVAPQNLMQLYEFIPLPVHFNFSGNVSVTPEVGNDNMIAVGHSQSYQIISSSDLQTCNKMGETYFCKGRNVLLTDLTKTCLGALYLANAKDIQDRCKFSIGGAQEKIFRLDRTRTWYIPSGRSIPITSVQKRSLFQPSRSPQAKQSESTPAATSGPWITSVSYTHLTLPTNREV